MSVSLNRKYVVTAASLQHTLHTEVYGAAVNEGKDLKFLQFWMEYFSKMHILVSFHSIVSIYLKLMHEKLLLH